MMNVYTAPNCTIKYEAINGYPIELEYANKYLTKGVVYTVQKCEVGRSSSVVYLNEIPDKSFNTVHFTNVGEVKLANPKDYDTYICNW